MACTVLSCRYGVARFREQSRPLDKSPQASRPFSGSDSPRENGKHVALSAGKAGVAMLGNVEDGDDLAPGPTIGPKRLLLSSLFQAAPHKPTQDQGNTPKLKPHSLARTTSQLNCDINFHDRTVSRMQPFCDPKIGFACRSLLARRAEEHLSLVQMNPSDNSFRSALSSNQPPFRGSQITLVKCHGLKTKPHRPPSTPAAPHFRRFRHHQTTKITTWQSTLSAASDLPQVSTSG